VTEPVISLAGPADRPRVVETFVAAFAADPAVRHFFPDDARYPTQAATFVGHLFDRRVRRNGVWLADDGAATALWELPTTRPGLHSTADSTADSTVAVAVDDAAGMAMDLPADVLARLSAYDAAVHHLLPAEPHWYLGVLATHPDHAGRRLGRAVMAAGVAAAWSAGLPAYLETSNPRNVDVYRGAGWSVVGETSIVDLRIWVMRAPVPA
jgi:GNAT superfamily N-acetyltransferase